MPRVERPRLTNRGAAGLLVKKTGEVKAEPHQLETRDTALRGEPLWSVSKKNKIISQLGQLVVSITTLNQDSENARLHPERNLEAVKDSLCLYGQLKPIVVQKWSERKQQKNVIVAGNGTHRAATELGWTKIAALIIEMTDAEAAGYGIADNRTAELAKWDFEVIARLDKLVSEAGHAMIGWSSDELEVLRMADWTPPSVIEEGFNGDGKKVYKLEFTEEQYEAIKMVTDKVRLVEKDGELTEDYCVIEACVTYLNFNGETDAAG